MFSSWYNGFKKSNTGCPNKHGNSVTNSISSFQIILWFSIVIHTEKAVIRKIFVCYVYNLFVYVLTAVQGVLSKRRKLQSKLVRLHCSSCVDIIWHIFTAIYRFFHKINSSRQNNTMAFEINYYYTNS